MITRWIQKGTLIVVIVGFFLPFLNTCTRKDREESKTKIKREQKASFVKPDGKNYSAVGYIISDFTFNNLPIWLLILSIAMALCLAFNVFINFAFNNYTLLSICIFGIAGLLFLLYIEELDNLKYGFWLSFGGYCVYILTVVFSIFKQKIIKTPV